MTETIDVDDKRMSPERPGLSSLQKSLFGVLAFFFVIHIVFWYLEFHAGVSHVVASTTLVVFVVGCFLTALALPWLPLPDQRDRTKSERLSAMVIVWVFIALIPRFIWELPWLFFRPDQSRRPTRRALDVHVVAHPARRRRPLPQRRPAHRRP